MYAFVKAQGKKILMESDRLNTHRGNQLISSDNVGSKE